MSARIVFVSLACVVFGACSSGGTTPKAKDAAVTADTAAPDGVVADEAADAEPEVEPADVADDVPDASEPDVPLPPDLEEDDVPEDVPLPECVSPGTCPAPASPCQIATCTAGTCGLAPQAGPCSDDSVCTLGDACQDGECVPGTAKVCKDDNFCTDDACDDVKGCTFVFNSAPCDDGNACTAGDLCINGACAGGAADPCPDATDICQGSSSTCDPATGKCSVPSVPALVASVPGTGSLGPEANGWLGQSVTVPKAGFLTGVELQLSACNVPAKSGLITVEVYDAAMTLLGIASQPQSSFPSGCTVAPLSSTSIGIGYFDYVAQKVAVKAGQELRFVIKPDTIPQTCDKGKCSVTQNPCLFDASTCNGYWSSGMRQCPTPCKGLPEDYAGGQLLFVAQATGAVKPADYYDLAFKLYVSATANAARPDTYPCNDGDACTSGDACSAGKCKGGAPACP